MGLSPVTRPKCSPTDHLSSRGMLEVERSKINDAKMAKSSFGHSSTARCITVAPQNSM